MKEQKLKVRKIIKEYKEASIKEKINKAVLSN
jgi:hypothetical protein